MVQENVVLVERPSTSEPYCVTLFGCYMPMDMMTSHMSNANALCRLSNLHT